MLAEPNQQDLPYFAYGVFKEEELAFHRLEPFLALPPQEAVVKGKLWIRDGLPLLERQGGGQVFGSLLRFQVAKSAHAYKAILELEPADHYRWEEVELLKPAERANVLVGRSSRKGSAECESESWTWKEDPVFRWGLEEVAAVARADGDHAFDSAPPEHFDWRRFFRLQAAYLLLWSAIERFTALRFGPGLEPGARVARLGDDPRFQEAAGHIVQRTARVVDSRDPDNAATLQPTAPQTAVDYYYRVRSNLSHRGKGAWRDGETVRRSLDELLRIFQRVLESLGIER